MAKKRPTKKTPRSRSDKRRVNFAESTHRRSTSRMGGDVPRGSTCAYGEWDDFDEILGNFGNWGSQ
jgi:hypothetical protein